VVSSFSDKFPKIRIRLMDEAAGQVVASVLAGECDFGIAFMGNQVPGVDFLPIHDDEFVLAMPRGHAMAKRRSVAWADLTDEKLIAVARSSGNRQLLDDALARAGCNPSYRFEVSHIATLLGMVEAGLGMAAVPRLALPANHPTLVGVSLRQPAVSRQPGPHHFAWRHPECTLASVLRAPARGAAGQEKAQGLRVVGTASSSMPG